MQTLIVQPETSDKQEAVKAVLKALKIKFVAQDTPEGKNYYNAEFEAKMKKSEEDIKEGRIHKISLDEIWK